MAARMSAAEFLDFTEDREGRWELVGGLARPIDGAVRVHDRIVISVLSLLRGGLSGRQAEPFTGNTFIRIPGGNYRMPDAGVDCGEAGPDDRHAKEPRLVVEVPSPSTRDFDMYGKLDEYKSVATLWHILLIDPDAPQATLWSRDAAGGWTHQIVAGLDAVLVLPALDLTLPMTELYARVEFAAKPRRVT